MKPLMWTLTRRNPFALLLGTGLTLIALGIGPRRKTQP